MNIMTSRFCVLCMLLMTFPCVCFAEKPTGYLNVKDFGAIGDNKTDDTAALQKVFDEQRKTGKTVFFPAGTYVISDTINMRRPDMRGESFLNTVIRQTKKDKDIFYVEFAWRGEVTNLSFRGGRQHLNMRNIRVDQGFLLIERCSFRDSSDFAIWLHPKSGPMHTVIDKCHFRNCEQVLFTPCDWTTLTNGWITTARMKNKAAIVNRGSKLLCANIVGVPIVTGQNDRWIDNYGILTCRNFRFGGEFGGMTPVYNYHKLTKFLADGGVILEDCYVAAQGSSKRCAIYCEEIPNVMVVRNCQLSSPAVSISPKIKLDEYFKHTAEGVVVYDLLQNSTLKHENIEVLKLLNAVKNRDTSPEVPLGQLNKNATQKALGEVVAKVQALPAEKYKHEFKGHKQKMDSKQYLDITPKTYKWNINEFMDSTTRNNNAYIAMAEAGDDIVFMRRAPNPPKVGAWPHVKISNIEVDLDKTPFFTWRQKNPGNAPLPAGYPKRSGDKKLDKGIAMPSGYAMRIVNKADGKLILLHETHTPPWYDYRAYDLRKIFDTKHGKITLDVKYYPLGAYITGLPGTGFAIPPEYQILDFIRLEAE